MRVHLEASNYDQVTQQKELRIVQQPQQGACRPRAPTCRRHSIASDIWMMRAISYVYNKYR